MENQERILTKEEQQAEALVRMKSLGLLKEVINDFEKSQKLYRSEHGILYWLTDEENEIVREWEEQTNNLVYHVIMTNFEFGLCYSFLYVSKHYDEWEGDREDIKTGYIISYVMNTYDECCSEYGYIGVKNKFGGLVRTA